MTLTTAAISRICSSGYTWWRIVIRDLSHGRIIAGAARGVRDRLEQPFYCIANGIPTG